jgi:hypothetical protein
LELARSLGGSYLKAGRPVPSVTVTFLAGMCATDEVAMTQPASTPQPLLAAPRPVRATLVAGGAIGVLILLGTLALWARYGTAVFFEMITAGFAACF